jgi:hypothetical protein
MTEMETILGASSAYVLLYKTPFTVILLAFNYMYALKVKLAISKRLPSCLE